MGFLDFFKSKPKFAAEPDRSMWVDFHSHLLPGLDDGCKTIENSLENIRELQYQGIKRIITTPHIFKELYPNTPEIIREKLTFLKNALVENNINIEIEATAEYYLDEWFCNNFQSMELLTMKGNYILINNYQTFHTLHDSGVLFQCNLLSFTGYYSPQIKSAAQYLLKKKMIHMVGSDIHKIRHSETLTKFKRSNEYQELLKLDLLNNSL